MANQVRIADLVPGTTIPIEGGAGVVLWVKSGKHTGSPFDRYFVASDPVTIAWRAPDNTIAKQLCSADDLIDLDAA
jgi:hypothetical protein